MRNSHLDALQLPQSDNNSYRVRVWKNRNRNEVIGTESRDFPSVLVDLYGWRHCGGRLMASSLGSRISEVKPKVRLL